MRSEVKGFLKSVRKFPKTMVGDDELYVFFTEDSVGVVVHNGGDRDYFAIGDQTDDWSMGEFRDTNAEITLINEPS